jgi:hypothetical protein
MISDAAADVRSRAESIGVKKAGLDFWTTLVLGVLARAFIGIGAHDGNGVAAPVCCEPHSFRQELVDQDTQEGLKISANSLQAEKNALTERDTIAAVAWDWRWYSSSYQWWGGGAIPVQPADRAECPKGLEGSNNVGAFQRRESHSLMLRDAPALWRIAWNTLPGYRSWAIRASDESFSRGAYYRNVAHPAIVEPICTGVCTVKRRQFNELGQMKACWQSRRFSS